MATIYCYGPISRLAVLQPKQKSLEKIFGLCMDIGPFPYGVIDERGAFRLKLGGNYQMGRASINANIVGFRLNRRLPLRDFICLGAPIQNAGHKNDIYLIY